MLTTAPTRSRAVAAVAALAAVAATLTGCQSPVVANRTGGFAVGAPASTGPDISTPAATDSIGEADTGTVVLSITDPVQVSGPANASVTCASRVRSYTAEARSVAVDGYRLSFTIRVAPYTGPGSYQALVTMRLDGAGGTVTTVSAIPQVPATITADGGSYRIDATGKNGRHLAASIEWTCS